MKLVIALLLVACNIYAAGPSLSMSLDNNKNFSLMIVGASEESVTYTISNTLGGPVSIINSDVEKSFLPSGSTFEFEAGTGTCQNLQNNQTCKLKITLNPVSNSLVQDIYQHGPELNLPFGGYPFLVAPPQDQKISVKVFSKWAATGKTPLTAATNVITSAGGTIYASQGNELYSLDTADNEWSKAYEPATGATVEPITTSVTAGDGTIYVGTEGSGVYKPNPDDTTHWLAEGTGLGTLQINKLFYYSSDLYAATSAGLYKLDDSTWTKDAAPAPQGSINDVYVSGSTMYVATDTGVEKFDGTTWTTMTGLAEQVNAFTRDANGNLFAATAGSALYELPTGKDVWEAVTETGLPSTNITGVSALLDNGVNYLFAFPTGNTGIYISQDAGKTWVAFNGTAVDNLHANKLYRSGNTYYLATSAGVFSRDD
jgi:hypothetical protein